MLLRPFAVEWVTPGHAGGLAALAARYGESWHRDLLDAWFGSRDTWRYAGDVDRKGWAGALPGLTAALRDAGAAAAAGWLLAASWGWLAADIRLWLGYRSPGTRRKQLAELGGRSLGCWQPLTGQAGRRDRGGPAGARRRRARLPAADAAGGRARTKRAPRGAGTGLRAAAHRDHRRPARAEDDWSVPWSGGCGCELCGTLGGFLADRSERTLEWPLAEARRKHVKDQISAAELPVEHEVWKFGSPHTLVLTKTDELFRREAKARKDATASLEWLAAQRRPQPKHGPDA